jgi:hypothetical protein
MRTHGTLFFFDAMLGDSEPLDWQVDHLTPLWEICCLQTQVVVATLTAQDGMKKHFIGFFSLSQVMSPMALLPTCFLAALLS